MFGTSFSTHAAGAYQYVAPGIPDSGSTRLMGFELLVVTGALILACVLAHRSPRKWGVNPQQPGGWLLLVLLMGPYLLAGCLLPSLFWWIQTLFHQIPRNDQTYGHYFNFFTLFPMSEYSNYRFQGVCQGFTLVAYIASIYLCARLASLLAMLFLAGVGFYVMAYISVAVLVYADELIEAIF